VIDLGLRFEWYTLYSTSILDTPSDEDLLGSVANEKESEEKRRSEGNAGCIRTSTKDVNLAALL
jgi:hypothetical protein